MGLSSFWTDPVNFGSAWLSLLTSPWLGLALLLPLIHLIWMGRIERKMYGKRLQPPTPLILRTWGLGVTAGILFSFLVSTRMWQMDAVEIIWIWTVTLPLAMWGIRFACLSYTAGILAFVSLLIQSYREELFLPLEWEPVLQTLEQFSSESWLWLVAVLHLLEWGLIRADGAQGAFPIQMKHDSGQWVNGYLLNKGWSIPLVLFTPAGWLPLSVLISFGRVTLGKPIQQQKRLASTLTLLYGLILCGILVTMNLWQGAIWVAAVFSFLGHELIYQWGVWQERRREPLYISDERGLRVMAVLPDSPAMAMGLKAGYIVQRVNGVRIRTIEDLEIVTQYAAFCKLEVLDEQLDRHIMQKALYEDDPRHLGIVGAVPFGTRPEEPIQEYQLENA